MKKMSFLLVMAVLGLVVLGATLAYTGILAAADVPTASFSIPWWTVDSGGGSSSGGTYRLKGTAGQPDAGTSSGGSYTLKGGYWSGVFEYTTYIPVVNR